MANKGTGLPLTPLNMAVLLALLDHPLHGYSLLKEIERQTDGLISPGTGSLYTALERLLEDGLIAETMPSSENVDQRRRYYEITDDGRSIARQEAQRMLRVLEVAHAKSLVHNLSFGPC